jgi:hypothetical protein
MDELISLKDREIGIIKKELSEALDRVKVIEK